MDRSKKKWLVGLGAAVVVVGVAVGVAVGGHSLGSHSAPTTDSVASATDPSATLTSTQEGEEDLSGGLGEDRAWTITTRPAPDGLAPGTDYHDVDPVAVDALYFGAKVLTTAYSEEPATAEAPGLGLRKIRDELVGELADRADNPPTLAPEGRGLWPKQWEYWKTRRATLDVVAEPREYLDQVPQHPEGEYTAEFLVWIDAVFPNKERARYKEMLCSVTMVGKDNRWYGKKIVIEQDYT